MIFGVETHKAAWQEQGAGVYMFPFNEEWVWFMADQFPQNIYFFADLTTEEY